MGPAFRSHFRVLGALVLAAAACTPQVAVEMAPSPVRPGDELEARLARIPAGQTSSSTMARAKILAALGRQDDALAELERAQDRARTALDWGALTDLIRQTGDVNMEMGKPQDALTAFGAALKAAAGMPAPVVRARVLVDIAYALTDMGMISRADAAIAEARLLVGEEALIADAHTAERMALVEARLLEVDHAAQLLAKARDGHAAAGDEIGIARAEVLRAGLLSRQKTDRRELDAVERFAIQSWDPAPLAWLRRFQAEASLRLGKTAQCENEADLAIRLADARGLVPVSKAARVVFARCAAENDHLPAAIRRVDEAAAIAEDQRRHLSGDNARKEMGFEAFLMYRLLLSLQVRLPEKDRVAPVFDTMERARARSHLDALLRSRAGLETIATETTEVLSRNKEEAQAEIRRITRELTESRAAKDTIERHRDALWALEDIKEAIAQENPLATRIRIPDPPTISELRKTLIDDRSLLLSWFVTQDEVVVVGVTSKEERLVKLALTPDTLGKTVRAYRRNVLLDPDVPLDVVQSEGKKLFHQLLGDFAAWVNTHDVLMIVPHGELASLPFEALVDENDKFLVETHEMSYGISATLSAELLKRKPVEGKRMGFVGMGDPVYDWASFRAGKPEGTPEGASRALQLWVETQGVAAESEPAKKKPGPILERLPGTAAELQAIAKLFGTDQRVYLRAEASEDNVVAGVFENARIVHIASHGLLEPHFQALALTLNPAAKEDGFLMQSEIVDLKLHADLVVLSACQTGRTKLRSGEPVAGLSLALRSAGAERVVLSLWSVDDEATAQLMVNFYRPLVKEGQGVALALAAAKRQMIQSGKVQPYYWAPFVLIGR